MKPVGLASERWHVDGSVVQRPGVRLDPQLEYPSDTGRGGIDRQPAVLDGSDTNGIDHRLEASVVDDHRSTAGEKNRCHGCVGSKEAAEK
jgi:hypothetical protein